MAARLGTRGYMNAALTLQNEVSRSEATLRIIEKRGDISGKVPKLLFFQLIDGVRMTKSLMNVYKSD